MPRSFFFYDFETDGSDPSTCQPVQFAGIRTDEALVPVQDGETVSWCRPAVDRLPAPEACLITGITPQQAAARGGPEAGFFHEVHSLLAEADTTSLGWNSLRFDDVVCRFGFWRNFIDPYEHSWRNGCTAWDLIDLARAARALRPEGLTWPDHDTGVPSFKLEHLAAANGIEHDDAHDALSDVRATLALGRLLRHAQPELWDWARSLTETKTAEKQLQGSSPLVHVSARIPADLGCTSPIRVLAEHPRNKRSFLCWDLRHDPGELLEADVDEIRHRTFSKKEALAEGEIRFALKEVKSNRAPFLAPLGVLKAADHDRLQLDDAQWRAHDARLTSDEGVLKDLRSRLREAWKPRTNVELDPDDALYADFPGDEDIRVRNRVPKARPATLADLGEQFRDPRLRAMMLHYRAREAPGTLDADERKAWDRRCRERLVNPPSPKDEPWPAWLEHLRSLGREPGRTADEQEILAAVESWGIEQVARLGLPVPAET